MVVMAVRTAEAQSGDGERFPNGYIVKGDFLRLYHSVADPYLLFGNPISNELSGTNGLPMQYFDRARFETSTSEKGTKVIISPLGYMLYEQDKAVASDVPTSSPTCRFFPKYGGHSVCYKFLQFYDANNGPEYFGDPISDPELRDGRIVQYFYQARMEYRPNQPSEMMIGLTNLGRLAMQKYTGVAPKIVSSLINEPDVQAKAFVSQALVPPKTSNQLFVVVQNRAFKAISGAKVHVTLIFPKDKREFAEIITNEDGIATMSIAGKELDPKEIIQIQATVEAGQTKVLANTYFRIWY